MTKPREKTREELTAEIEDRKKKIQQFENREKMLRQKLSKEERRTRSHRLIVRGAVFESIVPEAKTMTDEEAADLLRLALTGEEARAYLKKRAEDGKKKIRQFENREKVLRQKLSIVNNSTHFDISKSTLALCCVLSAAQGFFRFWRF